MRQILMAVEMTNDPLIEIEDLHTYFETDEGLVKAIEGVSFDVPRGRTLCVVGESGCGKSVTGRSILQIVDRPGKIVNGSIRYYPAPGQAIDITELSPHGSQMRAIRGGQIGVILQAPMPSLGPFHPIGKQIGETIEMHLGLSKSEARARTVEILNLVGIPDAKARLDAYPFQLSGGMRQRAMIALALSCQPKLLIADEPTTALDVTTQAVILDLIRDLQHELGMAVMFITHDLGVVAEIADEVAVMYLGQIVERASVDQIFDEPRHPYTQALLRSIPRLGGSREALSAIRGMVPHPLRRPSGCRFHPRCDAFMSGRCDQIKPEPVLVGAGHTARCLLYDHQAVAA